MNIETLHYFKSKSAGFVEKSDNIQGISQWNSANILSQPASQKFDTSLNTHSHVSANLFNNSGRTRTETEANRPGSLHITLPSNCSA